MRLRPWAVLVIPIAAAAAASALPRAAGQPTFAENVAPILYEHFVN